MQAITNEDFFYGEILNPIDSVYFIECRVKFGKGSVTCDAGSYLGNNQETFQGYKVVILPDRPALYVNYVVHIGPQTPKEGFYVYSQVKGFPPVHSRDYFIATFFRSNLVWKPPYTKERVNETDITLQINKYFIQFFLTRCHRQ